MKDTNFESENTGRKLNRKQRMQIRIRKLQKKNVSAPIILIAAFVLLFLMLISELLASKFDRTEAVVLTTDENTVLRMDFVGDVMLGRNIMKNCEFSGYDYLFSDITPYWNRADLVFANLEGAVLKTDPSDYEEANKPIHLYSSYNGVEAMLDAGVNVVGCANNHAFDYKEKAVSELIDYFQANSVQYTGIGKNLDEAIKYLTLDVNGIKVGFVAVTDVYFKESNPRTKKEGVLSTGYTRYNEIVRAASDETDLLVVYMHFGNENEVKANSTQKGIAHQLIDAGADLVIGSHPHVLQEMEIYKDKAIVYSLGNFIFDQGNSFSRDTAMLEFTLDQNGNGKFEIIPLRLEDGAPRLIGNSFYSKRINHELVQGLNKTDYSYNAEGHVEVPVISLDMNSLKSSEETVQNGEH